MVFEPELNCSIRPLKSGVRVHSGRSLRRGPGTQTLTRSLLALAQGPPADECSLAPLRVEIKKPPARGAQGAVLENSLPRACALRPLERFYLVCKVFGAAGPRGSGAAIFALISNVSAPCGRGSASTWFARFLEPNSNAPFDRSRVEYASIQIARCKHIVSKWFREGGAGSI